MTNTQMNILDINNFGDNLRKIRIEKGLTIEEFAFQIDKSARLIYDYENGLKFPSLARPMMTIKKELHLRKQYFK